MASSIDVIIDRSGNMKIEVNGSAGPNCLKETAELEKRLGRVGKRIHKPEFHRQAKQQQSQRQG